MSAVATKQPEANDEFLNEPVYPNIEHGFPINVAAGYRWVFARKVAQEMLATYQEVDLKSTGIHKMTNEQLHEQLIDMQMIYPEFMGGVVDDGAPNGNMPFPIHFAK